MKFLKQILRIIAAITIGMLFIKYFNIESGMLRILYYFGIYIVVSLIIEMIWNTVSKKKNK